MRNIYLIHLLDSNTFPFDSLSLHQNRYKSKCQSTLFYRIRKDPNLKVIESQVTEKRRHCCSQRVACIIETRNIGRNLYFNLLSVDLTNYV